MAIYLKFGTKGIATSESKAGQIAVPLRTFSLGITRDVTMEAGKPHAGEWSGTATFTKAADQAMMVLLKEALAADQALYVTMVPTRGRIQEIFSYKLSNCVLNNYDVSAHDTDDPIETLKLSFSVTEGFMQYSRHQQDRQSARRSL